MVPESILQGLTPEDLQLLLSGESGVVTVDDLKQLISFVDSRTAEDKINDDQTLEVFESIFWETLAGFTDHDRVKFVAYVTGTPVPDRKMEVRLREAPRTSADGPFARQCAEYLVVPSYPGMNAGLLTEVLRNAMMASMEFDTI